MAFLALLIAVFLWNFSTVAPRIQNDGWFFRFHHALEKIFPAKFAWIITVVLPSLVAGFFILSIQQAFFGLFALLLTIAIIIYGFGRGDLRNAWNIYVNDWRRGDFEAAYQNALKMQVLSADDCIETPFGLHQHMRAVLPYNTLERWFAPVFWFIVLGPAGIIAYRLLILVVTKRDEKTYSTALQVLIWVEWLPANLLAFTFALAGDFSAAFHRLQGLLFVEKSPRVIVNECAIAALEFPVSADQYPSDSAFYETAAHEIHALKNLIKRSHILWLVMFGFFMLI